MLAFRKTAESFTAGARSLPQQYFVSPEVYAQEEDRIFSRHWLCVGHQGQLPNSRDYFVQEVAGETLIILRDQTENIRGYYNVCRHRGTRICAEASGRFGEVIRCPYHAWPH